MGVSSSDNTSTSVISAPAADSARSLARSRKGVRKTFATKVPCDVRIALSAVPLPYTFSIPQCEYPPRV
jgi:hypothetical protein